MTIYDFISTYWLSIACVALLIAGLLILYKLGYKEKVRQITLALVVKAEQALGSGTGELKYAMVIDALYDKLPAIVRFLFSEKEIDDMIEEGVSKLKEVLSKDGVNLLSYTDEALLKE